MGFDHESDRRLLSGFPGAHIPLCCVRGPDATEVANSKQPLFQQLAGIAAGQRQRVKTGSFVTILIGLLSQASAVGCEGVDVLENPAACVLLERCGQIAKQSAFESRNSSLQMLDVLV